MGTNIVLLEKSEKELSTNFLALFRFSLKMHSRLYDVIKSREFNDEKLEKFRSYKEKIIEMKNGIQDDCVWIISKDQPRANHLRYIIAILYSIKDIERIAEYAFNIFYVLNKYNFPKVYLDEILDFLGTSNSAFSQLFSLFESQRKIKTEEEYEKIVSGFQDAYKNVVRKKIKRININTDQNIDDFYNFSVMIKYLERTIDHIQSVFNNFIKIN